MSEKLIRITAPHFCAGIIVKDDVIVFSAPILKWTIGKSLSFVLEWVAKKKYKVD